MFCIQASRPRTPIAASEPATASRDSSGLRGEDGQDLGDRAGRRQHHQHVGAGEEDPAQVLEVDRRAALAGSKKTPSKWRSISSIVSAASIAAPATSST